MVDTDSGREAASASTEQLGVDTRRPMQLSRFVFLGDSVVGFFAAPPSTGLPLVVSSFNFKTGGVTGGPKIDGLDSVRSVRSGRALASGRNGSLAAVDSTEVHWLLRAQEGLVVGNATLLEDGRAAAFVKRGGDPRLMVWSPEGRPTVDVPAPAGTSIVAGEPRVGWLALGPGANYSKAPRTVFVDSTTGDVVRVEEGLTPTGPWFEGPTLPAGSPGSRLFVGPKGEIVRLDPDTGRRDSIFVSSAPADAKYR